MIIDDEDGGIYMKPEEGYAQLKRLAAWLEQLSDIAQLGDGAGHIYVPQPHICAQLVRFMLPVEGSC